MVKLRSNHVFACRWRIVRKSNDFLLRWLITLIRYLYKVLWMYDYFGPSPWSAWGEICCCAGYICVCVFVIVFTLCCCVALVDVCLIVCRLMYMCVCVCNYFVFWRVYLWLSACYLCSCALTSCIFHVVVVMIVFVACFTFVWCIPVC